MEYLLSWLQQLSVFFGSNMDNRRSKELDIARGFAIMLVLYGHSNMELFKYIIYMFHMPLFFFISGSLHRSSQTSIFLFLKKKACRILFPYGVYHICLFACSFLGPLLNKMEQTTLYEWITGPLWFLPCLYLCSLLFEIFHKSMNKICNLILSLVIAFFGCLASTKAYPLPSLIVSVALSYMFYVIGSFRLTQYLNGHIYMSVTCLLFFFLLLVGSYKLHALYGFSINDIAFGKCYNNFFLYIIPAFAGICCVMLFSKILSCVPEMFCVTFLKMAGQSSLHIFALNFFAVFLGMCVGGGDMAGIALSLVLGFIVNFALKVKINNRKDL